VCACVYVVVLRTFGHTQTDLVQFCVCLERLCAFRIQVARDNGASFLASRHCKWAHASKSVDNEVGRGKEVD
jgi:hypothetical protein